MTNNASAAFFRAANLILMDYPYAAAIASGLRVCDEACVVIGQSQDETRDAIYALQAEYGADRLKIREETWVFDRGWQERWWDTCRGMTRADWHMYHDADEALDEAYTDYVRAQMQLEACHVLIFPYVHFFGTPAYQTHTLPFYTHNARLGRASAGFRMRNWCSDLHPTHAACQMVRLHNFREVDAHNPTYAPNHTTVLHNTPMLHYGWCRTPHALAISQAKHRAWYKDGDGLQDGRVPDVPAYDYRLAERLHKGEIAPYGGSHAADMAGWFAAHQTGWDALGAPLTTRETAMERWMDNKIVMGTGK